MKWFKNMKKGLERSAVEGRYRKVSTTAVAAVRGGLQEEAAPEKPQFKGGLSDKAAVRQMKEREELKAAVEKIIAGEYDEGERLLNEFEKAHPKSKEIKSVSEAREKLAELRKETQPQPAPEMKPEAPAGQ
jgi:TolA-binding protein